MIPVLTLLLLLAMPELSIRGAANGLLLWFNVVLPTLAPFMVCTQLVTLFGGMELLMRPCAPLFRRIFGLSAAGGYVLLCGLLCGYPLGAKLCAEFQAQGRISETESQYLLSICNHPSPMFLLGYVKNQLPIPIPPYLLLLCMYAPILPLSLLSRHFYGAASQNKESKIKNTSAVKQSSLDEILMSTCDTLVVIGGYIMLFSILAAWIEQIPILSVKAKALLSGIAEITTGVHQICTCGEFISPQLPVAAAVSFGGCSGIFQTRSVLRTAEQEAKSSNAKKAGLSIRHYLFWKLLHVIFTVTTLVLLQPVFLE